MVLRGFVAYSLSWGILAAIFGILGLSWGRSSGHLGHLGAILRLCWGSLGVILGILMLSLGGLGAILGCELPNSFWRLGCDPSDSFCQFTAKNQKRNIHHVIELQPLSGPVLHPQTPIDTVLWPRLLLQTIAMQYHGQNNSNLNSASRRVLASTSARRGQLCIGAVEDLSA